MIRIPRQSTILMSAVIVTLGFSVPAPAEVHDYLGNPDAPWPAKVEGHQPVQPGEHPRLLFRESDLPALRKKMNTPEGQAILKRLREQLNGGDGKTMPGDMGAGPGDGSEFEHAGAGSTFTISHVAGYGLLYQLTGEQIYADLARKARDAALAGYRGADKRYSLQSPGGALRAGPSLGWYAVGYDLAYDGWDAEYRRKITEFIENYDEGNNMSLEELVRGSRHHPRSNHWGMQVGGGAMALLAIMNDPGVDQDRIDKLLQTSQQAMKRNLTEGLGDGGYFAEGDGTGSMSSHIIFLPALQAWENAAGLDFYTPRPNAQWAALRWMLGTVVEGGKPQFPARDGYPHNVWDRDGFSGAGYFTHGLGVGTPEQQAAWLWFYNEFFKERDLERGTPYDTVSYLPHVGVMSLVNWPLDIQPVNPAEAIPLASLDDQYNYAMLRNRFQDSDDTIITILATRPRSHTKSKEIGPVWITTGGRRSTWGRMTGEATYFQAMQDGSATLATKDGTALAADFSGNAGGDMLVMSGPGAPDENTVDLNGRSFSFKFLGDGMAPEPKVDGDAIVVGQQKITYADGHIVLHNTAEPWDGPTPKAQAAAAGR
ncbi:MAG: hypothetical protein ACOC8H_00220 [bacterium]